MLDEILNKLGYKYEDLNATERETLNTWLTALQQGALTVEKVREYIQAMRDGVEQELTEVGHSDKKDILLKARLRNYMLLSDFLSTPDKAKKSMERALSNIKK